MVPHPPQQRNPTTPSRPRTVWPLADPPELAAAPHSRHSEPYLKDEETKRKPPQTPETTWDWLSAQKMLTTSDTVQR